MIMKFKSGGQIGKRKREQFAHDVHVTQSRHNVPPPEDCAQLKRLWWDALEVHSCYLPALLTRDSFNMLVL